MDTLSTTTAFSRSTQSSRDPSAHRRAYLDTYAKRRAGIATEAKSPVLQAPAQKVQAVAQPVVNVVPIQKQPSQVIEDFIQTQQPSVDGFIYRPVSQRAAVDETERMEETEEASQKTYLDILTARHEVAVAQAPAAEETVIAPTIANETDYLFDDPEAEARLEANLDALYSSSLTETIAKNTGSASAAHIRTIIASAVACGILAVGIFSFVSKYDYQPVVAQPIGAPVIEVESSNTDMPSGTPVAANASGPVAVDASHPVRLVISGIGVNAPVEGLGTTPEGLIAVPKSYGVVGWYNKGSVPGKAGPAVLVGHYTGGNKGVFDNLANLKDGDLITTTNGKGQSFTYRVTAKNEYDRDKVPMADLFKKSDHSRLEIITCAGKWQANNYEKRLVVTAELVR